MAIYKKRHTLHTIFGYLLAFLLVLQCNSIYLYSTPIHVSTNVINLLCQIFFIILFTLALFQHPQLNFLNLVENLFILFFVTLLIIIYNFIVFPSFNKSYIIKLLVDPILLIVYFYSLNNSKEVCSLFFKFENLVVVISMMSLFFWILYICKFPTNTVTFSSWGTSSVRAEPGYFYLSAFNINMTSMINVVRNPGIFAEPSIFGYVLTIALLIELFIRKNKKLFNYRIIILLIAVLSTDSTIGIIISVPAVLYNILLVLDKNNAYKFILLCLLPIAFILLKTVLINKIDDPGLGKTMTMATSFNIRNDDILAGIKTWLNHPLLGCGLGINKPLIYNMSGWRFLTDMTSVPSDSAGFTTILAQGGLITGLLYVLPIILISKYSFKFMGMSLFLFIASIYIISQDYYIFIMILSYFWSIIMVSDNILNGKKNKYSFRES